MLKPENETTSPESDCYAEHATIRGLAEQGMASHMTEPCPFKTTPADGHRIQRGLRRKGCEQPRGTRTALCSPGGTTEELEESCLPRATGIFLEQRDYERCLLSIVWLPVSLPP